MDLATDYLGLRAAQPARRVGLAALADASTACARLADAGVGAVVLYSLFEEQLRREVGRERARLSTPAPRSSPSRSRTSRPPPRTEPGPRRYLSLLERAAAAVDDAGDRAASTASRRAAGSTTPARWRQAGAAAIELNVYYLPGDTRTSGRDVEQRHVDILRRVKAAVGVPVAVKLGPYFSSHRRDGAPPRRGRRRRARALQPLPPARDRRRARSRWSRPSGCSSPAEARLPRTWIALLHGRVRASLAATTGVDTPRRRRQVPARRRRRRHDRLGPAPPRPRVRDGAARRARRLDAAQALRLASASFRGLLAVPPEADGTTYERAGYVSAVREANESSYGPWA